MNDTMTLTFGDVAENHAGMQQIGTKATEGFHVDELYEIGEKFKSLGYVVNLIDLVPKDPIIISGKKLDFDNSKLLIVKNGMKELLPSDMSVMDLHSEHAALPHDMKAFMYGRVVNKRARYNLCFADKGQEPDYASKKGRIVAFKDVPLTYHIRSKMPELLGTKASNLQLEGNYYYDVTKCGIGYHGDTERRLVVGLRLGATMPLHYQWYYYNKPLKSDSIGHTSVTLDHGDIYVMSDKATGYDWKKKSITTLRHAAGCSKFTSV